MLRKIATFLSCAGLVSHAADAMACGGCFHEQQLNQGNAKPSLVTSHRMALAITPDRTVLWDQVQYAGDPTGFAWVLPVGKGAYLDISHDAWFEALDAVTGTRVASHTVTCPGGTLQQTGYSGGGFGCGGSTKSAMSASGGYQPDASIPRQGADSDVQVLHEGTAGPYETVTLAAADAANLEQWLKTHGYVVPPELEPLLADYIKTGADFIALRLKPNAGTRQMQPVRVVTPGASPILPLKMVAAGTGANTAITLFVIAEGRYQAKNFGNNLLSASKLSWDWTAQSSDLPRVRDELTSHDAFVTTFARPQGLTTTIAGFDGKPASYDAGSYNANNLADLYHQQAAVDEGFFLDCSSPSVLLSQADRVTAKADGAGSLAADKLDCHGADDLAAALVGLHPKDVWVTRLEANLDRQAFDRELELEPAMQAPIANWLVAQFDTNKPTCSAVGLGTPTGQAPATPRGEGCGCNLQPILPNALALGPTAAFALLLLRRKRRRSSQRTASS